MLTKEYTLTQINNIDFEITWAWGLLALLLTTSFSTPESYDRYLTVIETISPITITPAFPTTPSGMTVFAITLIIGVYTSVVLHEFGHATAAKHYGIRVKAIRLWFAGGVALIDTIPPAPRKEFIITIAGPIVTALLIPVTAVTALLFYTAEAFTLSWLFLLLTLFNTGILALNLTPALPLDGGRMFRAGLTRKFSYKKATTYAVYTTTLIGITASITAAYAIQPGYIVLALIVIFLATQEYGNLKVQYKSRKSVRDPKRFLLHGQTVTFADDIPSYTKQTLTPYVTDHGGSITESVTDADFLIVPTELKHYHVGAQPSDSTVTVLTIDVLCEYADLHGTPVQPDPTELQQQRTGVPAVKEPVEQEDPTTNVRDLMNFVER